LDLKSSSRKSSLSPFMVRRDKPCPGLTPQRAFKTKNPVGCCLVSVFFSFSSDYPIDLAEDIPGKPCIALLLNIYGILKFLSCEVGSVVLHNKGSLVP
jgi:hypothetical protein